MGPGPDTDFLGDEAIVHAMAATVCPHCQAYTYATTGYCQVCRQPLAAPGAAPPVLTATAPPRVAPATAYVGLQPAPYAAPAPAGYGYPPAPYGRTQPAYG